ncbi:MAG TPA: hypothetical protein VI636_09650 [Candidatus Angelobacter sp.]
MNDPVTSFIIKFNKIIAECEIFTFITRDSALQRDACRQLQDLLAAVEAEKKYARTSGKEDYANVLLGCECVASGLVSEINMWLLLKDGRPDEAWGALVDAQSRFLSATKADEGFAHLDQKVDRLKAIEQLIFPPQVFLSSGMIVKSQICSICEGEYEDCVHVKGRPYMGEFCTVRLIPSAVDHVAMVDKPANKRCRVFSFSDAGGQRNRMTWMVTAAESTVTHPDGHIKAEGVIAVIAPQQEKTPKEDISFQD